MTVYPYLTKLYGHPNQVMPSHIVVTSPYFDTREVVTTSTARGAYIRRADIPARLETIAGMRAAGVFWKDIGYALGIHGETARTFYGRNIKKGFGTICMD